MSDAIKLKIVVDDVELTAKQMENITVLAYIDNDDMHSDDLQIITNDASVFSDKEKIQVAFTDTHWQNSNKTAIMNCGTFHIDDKKESDTTGMHIFKAAAITAASKVRQDKKSHAWERINLKKLAEDITKSNGINLIYATEFNPIFSRKEQLFESDIKFLSDVCRTVGLSLKFTDNAVAIFSPYEHGKKEAVRTFSKGDAEIRDDTMHHKKNDTAYGKCCVSYYDPVKKELIIGEHIASENGRVLQIRRKVSSTEEAKTIAMYALREKNSKEYTGYIECDGDISLVTGAAIELKGWEEFDRKYIVKKAIHTIKGSTYTTKIFFEMAEV